MKLNIRKIVSGADYSNCIRYVKGSEYRVGPKKCVIEDFMQNEVYPTAVDIYVNDGDSTFLWKTLHKEPLEVEYDANFS